MKFLYRYLLIVILFPCLTSGQTVEDYHACMERGADPVEYVFRLFEEA